MVENTFSILSTRFRCLHTTAQQNSERFPIITIGRGVLHNLLRMRNSANIDGLPVYDDHDSDGANARRPCPKSVIGIGESYQVTNPTFITKHQREYLVKYVH